MSWMKLKKELTSLRVKSTSCGSRAVTLAPRLAARFQHTADLRLATLTSPKNPNERLKTG